MKRLLLWGCIMLTLSSAAYSTILIPFKSSWKYLDNGTDQGTTWTSSGFSDASWSSGNGELGFGDGDEGTVIGFGSDANNKYITTYFRKTFNNPGGYSSYTLSIKRDDGAVVYVNGVEVFRNNIAVGHNYQTLATTASDDGAIPLLVLLPASAFVSGANTIAVEMHQSAINSSDLSFDLSLSGNDGTLANLIELGSRWKYLDNGTNQSTSWRALSFADDTWLENTAEFGYGDGDESTTVSYGANASAKYITTYFRKKINITNAADFNGYEIRTFRDDGVVIYVNGAEVWRNNMPYSTISYTTLALAAATDDGEVLQKVILPASVFSSGENCIAVEVHQNAASSSDLSFDLQLLGNTQPDIIRGPYLQMGSPTSVNIRFKTTNACITSVAYGPSLGNYNQSVQEVSSTSDHSITLTGLTPNTKYYYAVKLGSVDLQSGASNFFITHPPFGSEQEVNILATGDCGTGYQVQKDVLNRYMGFMGNKHTDVWMLVGDNAYDSGLDREYQTGFFEVYQDSLLKNVLLYPAPGNHDYANSSSRQNDKNVPYYSIFNVPTAGEIGGVASGTESYYSYNYGNVHFISLDSYGRENSSLRLYDTLSPQVEWLKADLAANTQPWTIVYFHHPPYTMGSHNSDTETELINLRQRLLTILERYKVDLLICGHSHDYERSYLLKGHYGLETSFDMASHAVSSSNGKYDGSTNSCPYVKNKPDKDFGTVYIVTGSAGKVGGSQAAFPHNAMVYSNATIAGATAISIKGNRLDAKFISSGGVVLDKFTMMKEVNKHLQLDLPLMDTLTLEASWNGSYNWTPGSNAAKSIVVSPTVPQTFYVNDVENCLKDTFDVNVITPSIQCGSLPDSVCAGSSMNVPFNKTGKFFSGNIFTVQLSDQTGSFALPTTIGTKADTASGSIPCVIPANILAGNGYKIRIVASHPSVIGSVSENDISIFSLTGAAIQPSYPTICAGQSITLTASGGTSYIWNTGAATAAITVSPAINTNYTATVYNGAGCSATVSKMVYVSKSGTLPVSPSAISGSASVCENTQGSVYSIAPLATAVSYHWEVSAGTIVSGQGTTSIAVNFPATYTSVTIKVQAINACGNAGSFRSLIVKPPPRTSIAGAISGELLVCSGATDKTYSIAPVANAVSYNWTISQGTITSPLNGTSITLDFPSSYTSSTISVQSFNKCGFASTFRTAVVKPPVSVMPGLISGSISVCGGATGQTYSIAPVASASAYYWETSAGNFTTPVNGTSVSLNFPATYSSLIIKVQSINACGVRSAFRSLIVKPPVLTVPGLISGPVEAVCGGSTGVQYAVSPVAGAVGYNWVASAGVITSGQGTNTISLNVPATYTSLTLKVQSVNVCGVSSILNRGITIKSVPLRPLAMTGPSESCPGAPLSFSASAVSGASSYVWTASAGWSITGGQGTTNVSVLSGTASGYMQVYASNICGNSVALKKLVSVVACLDSETDIGGQSVEARQSSIVNIFPNPAHDLVTVQGAGMKDIQLIDISGRVLREWHNIDSFSKEIELPYPAGVYFIHITGDTWQETRKLVVE